MDVQSKFLQKFHHIQSNSDGNQICTFIFNIKQGSFWASHVALKGFANFLPMLVLMFKMLQKSQ